MLSHPDRVNGKLLRCLRVWVVASAAALAGWLWLPGSAVDRIAFESLARWQFGTGELQVSGTGQAASPWQVSTQPDLSRTITRPAVVMLNDDVEGFFQESPHAPIDFAVIFRNMHRMGARNLACASLLAWDAPDPIGLTALENTMDQFRSVVLAVPLTRGPTSEPLPPAFRRASLPVTAVTGNPAALPVVNRVALPKMIYGKDNSLAGFQTLESEPSGGSIPLIARWDDRVVFSFHLLATMRRSGKSLDDMRLHIGRAIDFGHDSVQIPIDDYGHLATEIESATTALEIPAESLIDGDKSLLHGHPFQTAYLCDQRSNIGTASIEFNRSLPALASTLDRCRGETTSLRFPRLTGSQELFCLLTYSLLLAFAASLGCGGRVFTHTLMALACLFIHTLVFQKLDMWLPGIPAIATTLAAMLSSIHLPPRRAGVVVEDPPFTKYSGQ